MAIFYWHGILISEEVNEEFKETIKKILQANYASLNLEKLKNYNVFSARINRENRLLFTTITKDGKNYLLFLEVVRNHDYQSARFLRSGVLKRFLEKNKDVIEQTITDECFTPIDLPDFGLEEEVENEIYSEHVVDFFNGKCIELNITQQEILKANLPVVVTGMPGSGKSSVAFSLLGQCFEKRDPTSQKKFVYMAQSRELVEQIKTIWLESPFSQSPDSHLVEFKCYQDLIAEIAPDELEGKSIVGEMECTIWLTKHIQQYQTIQKAIRGPKEVDEEFFLHLNKMYQEFRIICGLSSDEYLAQGQKQCNFHNIQEKQWLYTAYERYLTYLKRENQIDLAFLTVDAKNLFELAVVDEGQDLSVKQINQLIDWTMNEDGLSNIAFCYDSHQLIYDNKSKLSLLIARLRQQNSGAVHIDLPYSYRCAKKIAEFSEHIILLRTLLAGGVSDKDQKTLITLSPEQEKTEGQVIWLKKDDLFAQKDKLRAAGQTTKFAVVTLPAYVEEAKQFFGTDLVFTAREIKGLEYDFVLVYRMLNTPHFKIANNKLKLLKDVDSATIPSHRPKQGKSDEECSIAINELFIACTRARESLIIYQEDIHPLKMVIQFLTKTLDPAHEKILHTEDAPSSAGQWIEEARRLEEAGLKEKADSILRDKTEKKEEKVESIASKARDKKLPVSRESKSCKQPKKDVLPKQKTSGKKSKKIKASDINPKKVIKPKSLQDFANVLWTHFNLNNLKSLFKYEKCRDVLFSTFIEKDKVQQTKDVLFDAIILDPEKMKLLCYFLMSQPEETIKISIDDLTRAYNGPFHAWKNKTVMEGMIYSPLHTLFLNFLIDNNIEIAHFIARYFSNLLSNRFSVDYLLALSLYNCFEIALFDLPIEVSAGVSLTLFEQIIREESKQTIFIEILNRHPNLLEKFTKRLCLPYLENDKETSILIKTLKDENSKNGLQTFAENNDVILTNIAKFMFTHLSVDILNHLFGYRFCLMVLFKPLLVFKNNQFLPLLFCLLNDPEKKLIFETFLKLHPEYIAKIPSRCFMFPIIEKDEKSTILDFLISNEQYINVVNLLARNNSDFYRECCKYYGVLLTKGHEVKLLVQLFKYIFWETVLFNFKLTFNSVMGKFKESIFNYLLRDPKQFEILNEVLKHPEIAKLIPVTRLCETNPLENDSSLTTMPSLFAMAVQPRLPLLKSLVLANPNFPKEITSIALCQLSGKSNTMEADYSVLFWLTFNSQGEDSIFDLFVMEKEFAQKIIPDSFYHRVSDPNNDGISPFVNLCIYKPDALKTLFINNEELLLKLTIDELIYNIPVTPSHNNCSALFLLCLNENGHNVLKHIFESRQDLLSEITAANWCKFSTVLQDENEGLESPFTLLQRSELGQAILALIPETTFNEIMGFKTTGLREIGFFVDTTHPSEVESLVQNTLVN